MEDNLMKKCIILFLALLFWQTAVANVVTVEEARRRAVAFFNETAGYADMKKASQGDFKLVYSYPESTVKSSAPALYVFEQESGGYAVVSGDDAARPILGYSLDGQFPVKDMPENLQAMLHWYADIIAYARTQGWKSDATKAAGTRGGTGSVRLYTARWGQGDPFNRLVSEIDGQKPPIGCVATAIAIIMRYYKYPSRGTGKLPTYSYEKEGRQFTVEGFALGHEYDWDMMPEAYTESYTEEEALQLSRLLYDVAVMCRMRFYPGGSSANVISGSARLATYYGYDKQMASFRRSDGYADNQWEQMVRDEIDAGRPVLYIGTSDRNTSHAFVIDGYSGQDYFGINYGWSTKTSVFYTITPIPGRESQLMTYYKNQYMVNRLMPKEQGSPSLYAESVNLLPIDFSVGKPFSMQNSVRNRSPFPASVDLCYVLFDRGGSFKDEVSPVQHFEIPAGGSVSVNVSSCKLTARPEDGDKVVLSYRDMESGEWIPVDQFRSSHIVFTTEPLRNKVSVDLYPGRERDISVKMYKDVAWEILNEERHPLIGNMLFNESCTHPGYSYLYTMLDGYDPRCDVKQCRIWLPNGVYLLRLVNPATGEEVVITLKI